MSYLYLYIYCNLALGCFDVTSNHYGEKSEGRDGAYSSQIDLSSEFELYTSSKGKHIAAKIYSETTGPSLTVIY